MSAKTENAYPVPIIITVPELLLSALNCAKEGYTVPPSVPRCLNKSNGRGWLVSANPSAPVPLFQR